MNVYFDTEFTGLSKDTTLISIGLVSQDGKKFYAELTDYDVAQVTPWIKENVMDNLFVHNQKLCEQDYYHIGDKQHICAKLKEWFAQFDEVQLVSDVCHYDMVLLIDMFGTAFDLPKNISPVCIDINTIIAKYFEVSEKEAFDISRESIVKRSVDGEKHNALYDALIIKEVFDVVTRPYVKYVKE